MKINYENIEYKAFYFLNSNLVLLDHDILILYKLHGNIINKLSFFLFYMRMDISVSILIPAYNTKSNFSMWKCTRFASNKV